MSSVHLRLEAYKFFKMLKDVIWSMPSHNAFEMSGYLAFLTIISIFPCSIFLAKLAGLLNQFFIHDQDGNTIASFLANAFESIKDLPIGTFSSEIVNILQGPPKSVVGYAVVSLIWTSSSSIEGIRNMLNRAYQVSSTPNYFLGRLASIIQFVVISLFTIFIVSFIQVILPTIIEFVLKHSYNYTQTFFLYFIDANINTVKYTINILLLLVYVLWLHYSLTSSSANLKFKNILPGALITVALWLISSKVLAFYFTKFLQFNIIYGGLANIVAILLFFYVIFLCFIFGAEFNYFYKKYDQ